MTAFYTPTGAPLPLSRGNSALIENEFSLIAAAFNAVAAQLAQTATIPNVALLAPLASPVLTGVPTAPTATPGASTTQLANTAFVATAVAALASPAASLTASGYYTLPGGLILQWGSFSFSSLSGLNYYGQTITLPLTLVNNNFAQFVTVSAFGDGSTPVASATGLNKSNIHIGLYAGPGATFGATPVTGSYIVLGD